MSYADIFQIYLSTLKNKGTEFTEYSDFLERGVLMSNPVEKGKAYEEQVVRFLKENSFKASRTNVTNEHDPSTYKHGFDGGVDIIASCASEKFNLGYTFYIQCKCHKKDLTKTAIAEVYAGVRARHAEKWNTIPLVFANCNASQETIQYAKDLGVELFLKKDYDFLIEVKESKQAPYGNYGVFMRILLFKTTQNPEWIKTLPVSQFELSCTNMTESVLMEAELEFNSAQSYLDTAVIMERKASEARQKALDIQKRLVYKALVSCGMDNKNSKKENLKDTNKESSAKKKDEESG